MGKEKIISGDDHEQDDTDTNNIADANLQTEFLAKSDEKIQASSDPVHNAFLLLYRTLELMRILDKRRWQHVVAYKVRGRGNDLKIIYIFSALRCVSQCAWMQYHIFKNAASAQEDIQSLFHMRITAKSFQAFYITEFER